MEDEKEIINPEDKDYADGHLMRVCLWSGAGYSLSEFYVYVRGDDAEYALDKTVAYCEEKGYNGLIMPVNEVEDMAEKDYAEEVANYDGDLDEFITNYLNYVYVDATMEGASQPYYVYGENLRIENVEEPINESEENTTGPYSDIKIYMNTWANYNENGADLSKYGIKDGWLTVDEALDFCEKYADDEPFINDTDDNTGICKDISDYDNAVTVLKAIKALQDYANNSGQDMTFIQDMFEAWYQYEDGTLSEENINEFIKFVEEGDYYYYPDVNNSYDLGYYLVDEFGPSGINNVEAFIDYDHLQRDLQYDVDTQLSDEEWYEVDDSEVDDFIANANVDTIGPYFDFEKLGEAIELEQHVCYTTNGNCVSML